MYSMPSANKKSKYADLHKIAETLYMSLTKLLQIEELIKVQDLFNPIIDKYNYNKLTKKIKVY